MSRRWYTSGLQQTKLTGSTTQDLKKYGLPAKHSRVTSTTDVDAAWKRFKGMTEARAEVKPRVRILQHFNWLSAGRCTGHHRRSMDAIHHAIQKPDHYPCIKAKCNYRNAA